MFEINDDPDMILVSKIGIENRNALIIDDFYKNPDEVRQYALDSPKKTKETDPGLLSGLSGSRVFEQDSRVKDKMKSFFDELSKQPIWNSPRNFESQWYDDNWNRIGFMCNITNQKSMDVGGGIPHQDSFDNRFGSVIYLNTPEECQGGTRIYSYFGAIGFYQADMIDSDPNKRWVEPQSFKDNMNEITMHRWKNHHQNEPDEGWKVEAEFEMKYNRCILYEADVLHGIWQEPDMFIDYDRIAQVLFM